MKVLNILDSTLKKIEEFILSFSIITIAAMVCGNAIARNFLSSSWAFAEEISRLALFMATFMGISYVARKGRHLSMSAVYDNVPFKFRKALATIIPFFTAIVLFVFAYYSWLYIESTIQSGRVTSALRLPYYVMLIWAPLGFILGGIQFLRNFWINVRNKDVYLAVERKDYDDDDDADNPSLL
ncbi:TRAP transporter small permease [Alteribacillus sp. HJP-4]|uniref:TRAP transporter small permease n=1 Tax=Alteribacillus sp. HJP-4 TaxID=2775394 RepID=UPI0035CD1B7A